MLKLEQRFKGNEELKQNYFNFMGKLFDDGHAVEVKAEQINENAGKIWYQSHFCVNTSNKFCVCF